MGANAAVGLPADEEEPSCLVGGERLLVSARASQSAKRGDSSMSGPLSFSPAGFEAFSGAIVWAAMRRMISRKIVMKLTLATASGQPPASSADGVLLCLPAMASP
jgi:hypothetical protein